jgi:hypothetical protein
LPANAVGQIEIRRLTQPVRQQAGSYRLISTPPMHRVDRHASWPANAARVCGSSAESELTKIGAETQTPVGVGLLANAVCQIGIRRLTQPVRQQAGSYRLISTQPMHRVDRHASWPANAARVCGSTAESELTKIGAETQIPVGAGLLANAVGQIEIRRLTQPVRQQAGSYRLIQPNRCTA